MSDEEMKSVAASCRHFYWKLFQSTFLISAFTVGGGFVIIPLLRAKYVDEYGWLDDKETLNLVSIAQSMPGVVAVNAAIILGYRMAGLRGALTALAAVFLYSPMVRRLHDIGWNERLAQAYLCFGILQGFLLGKVAALPPGSLGLYAFEAALAAVTLLFIVLIFHAGEPRRNVYGAVPGRAAAAQQTGRKKGSRLKKAGTV